jgi:hypothetical protein
MLGRHRRDVVRRARVEQAGGPLVPWLVTQFPSLAAQHAAGEVRPGDVLVLHDLPVPDELRALAAEPPATLAATLGRALAAGELGPPHRGVLVNLLARIARAALAEVHVALRAVEPTSPGHGLAAVLADLADTRRRMLDELEADGAT